MALGTPAEVANRIGAPLWAESPATGISCAGEAPVGTTITWWGSLPLARASSCSIAAAAAAGARGGRVRARRFPGTEAEEPTLITWAPPSEAAPRGWRFSIASELTPGSEPPLLNSSGAFSGMLASEEAASAVWKLPSSTTTIASGRLVGVRPG